MAFTQNRNRILLYLIYALLFIFAAVKVKENGDFIGYVNAGNLVLNHGDIYSDAFNTWPPAFSIISVPLAVVNNFSFVFVRILWMVFLFFCFFYCIRTCISFFEKTKLTYKELLKEVLVNPWYLLALFLTCRAFMDNLIYMQINTVMLASCLYFMEKAGKRREFISAVLLGLSIGAKVYNIFLLPVVILFRKWESAFYIIGGIVLTFLLCFMVFGVQQTMDYYEYWIRAMVDVKQSVVHRNQSLIAGLMRLFSMDNFKVNQTMPLADLSFNTINALYYGLVLVLATLYLVMFLGQLKKPHPDFIFHSCLLVLVMVPLLTPVSWKANYIYSLPGYFFMCHAFKEGNASRFIQWIFGLGAVALCLSNEAIIGRPAMYFLETWNILVIGELLLFFSILLQMQRNKSAGVYSEQKT